MPGALQSQLPSLQYFTVSDVSPPDGGHWCWAHAVATFASLHCACGGTRVSQPHVPPGRHFGCSFSPGHAAAGQPSSSVQDRPGVSHLHVPPSQRATWGDVHGLIVWHSWSCRQFGVTVDGDWHTQQPAAHVLIFGGSQSVIPAQSDIPFGHAGPGLHCTVVSGVQPHAVPLQTAVLPAPQSAQPVVSRPSAHWAVLRGVRHEHRLADVSQYASRFRLLHVKLSGARPSQSVSDRHCSGLTGFWFWAANCWL